VLVDHGYQGLIAKQSVAQQLNQGACTDVLTLTKEFREGNKKQT